MDQKALVQQMMVKAVHAAAKAQEEMLDEKLHELDGYVAIGRPPARVLCCVVCCTWGTYKNVTPFAR